MRWIILVSLFGCTGEYVFQDTFTEGGGGIGSSVVSGTGGNVGSVGGFGTGGDISVPCMDECEIPNAVSSCVNDQCVITECVTGFNNCNGQTSDGCEINILNDSEHCGDCVTTCQMNHATSECLGGQCSYTCINNYADCGNGCESVTTNENCGSCGVKCVNSAVCSASSLSCICLGLPSSPHTDTCHSDLSETCCQQIKNCAGDSNCWNLYSNKYWHLTDNGGNFDVLKECYLLCKEGTPENNGNATCNSCIN